MKTYRAEYYPVAFAKAYVDLFYDTHCRIWTVLLKDSNYNQIGEADYAHGCRGLKEAKAHANFLFENRLGEFKVVDDHTCCIHL